MGIKHSMEEMGMAYIDKIKERARQDKKTIVLPETTDKSFSFTMGSTSIRVKIFSAEAMALCRVVNISASSWMGWNSWLMYWVNMYSVPMEIAPVSTCEVPPPRMMAVAMMELR